MNFKTWNEMITQRDPHDSSYLHHHHHTVDAAAVAQPDATPAAASAHVSLDQSHPISYVQASRGNPCPSTLVVSLVAYDAHGASTPAGSDPVTAPRPSFPTTPFRPAEESVERNGCIHPAGAMVPLSRRTVKMQQRMPALVRNRCHHNHATKPNSIRNERTYASTAFTVVTMHQFPFVLTPLGIVVDTLLRDI